MCSLQFSYVCLEIQLLLFFFLIYTFSEFARLWQIQNKTAKLKSLCSVILLFIAVNDTFLSFRMNLEVLISVFHQTWLKEGGRAIRFHWATEKKGEEKPISFFANIFPWCLLLHAIYWKRPNELQPRFQENCDAVNNKQTDSDHFLIFFLTSAHLKAQ